MGLVTVLFNSPEVLPEFFESLASQVEKDWFLEVIDNSPDDGTITAARECAAKLGLANIRFTKNTENVGVAKANNQGIANCLEQGAGYIVLLNNDIVFGPELLRQMRDELAGGESLVAPRIHYHDNDTLWYAGGHIRPVAATANHYRDREAANALDREDRYTSYAPTCFLGLRAEIFEQVGVMDERYFVYYDDTDFIFRCLKQGHRIRYLGRIGLKHKVSSSTGGGSSAFSIYYYNRNRLFFVRKNYAGIEKYAAYIWYFMTRFYKYLRYDQARRTTLRRAISDGWQMR